MDQELRHGPGLGVRALTKFHPDERWGGHMDIGYSGHIEVPLTKLEYWTIELWIRLKEYTIVNNKGLKVSPTLLKVGNTSITYNTTEIQIKNHDTDQSVHFKYPIDQWFQLVITNGKPDQLGYDSGSIYINGKELAQTMIFPFDIKNITIGNKLKPGYKVLANTNYPSESSLSVMRVYSRILDKHESYNNYLAQARQFALLMETQASPIKDSLVIELLAHRNHYDEKSAYWMSSREVLLKRKAQHLIVQNKNPEKSYMNQIDELTRIVQSFSAAPQSRQAQQVQPVQCAKKTDVDGDIIILSRNPEMFLKQLQKPDDKQTKKLLLQNQPKVHQDDYSGIFDNPFKLKLLVVYLRNNPTHFMTLLKSDVLAPEQLVTLSNALNNTGSSTGAGAGASSSAIEGFTSLGMISNDPVYQVALNLLESQVQSVKTEGSDQQTTQDTGPYAPYLSQLASQTSKIANIMYFNHQKEALQNQVSQRVHLMDTIKQLNDNISNVRERSDKLEKLLAQQSAVLGLIISKHSGKCIGAIDRNGKIKHCAHREAQSPYNIIVNKQAYSLNLNNILQQHRLHGSSVSQILKEAKGLKMQVLGQCVNIHGKTIGLIVRQSDGNHYIPTQPGHPVPDVPILAILAPNTHSQPQSQRQQGQRQQQVCSTGKCKPGYHAVENKQLNSEDWLGQEQEQEQEQEALAQAPRAHKAARAQKAAMARIAQKAPVQVQTQPKAAEEIDTGAPLSQEEAEEENATMIGKLNTLFSNSAEEESGAISLLNKLTS